MKEKTKNVILYSIAGLFLIIVALVIHSYVQDKSYSAIFWACYTCMVLIAMGIFFRKSNLILAQICILLIPDLLWTTDFIFMIIRGSSLLGTSDYYFEKTRGLLFSILSLHHIFVVPLSLFALSLMKTKTNHKAILISFTQTIIFLTLGFIIGNGINFLPESEYYAYFPQFIPYPIIWLIVMFLFSVASYILVNIPRLIKEK